MRQKSVFDKHTTHEIRNALTVIQSNNDFMEMNGVYDKTAIEAIQIGVVRIATIINDIDEIREAP